MYDTFNQFKKKLIANQKNTDASIKNLEIWIGQLTKQLADQQKVAFNANMQSNPKKNIVIQSLLTKMNNLLLPIVKKQKDQNK